MAILIKNDKYVGAGLNYIKNENGLFFYYDNNLLILHDTGSPFLTVLDNDNAIGLQGNNVIRNNDCEYTLDFFQAKYLIRCRIHERDGVIDFTIENPYEYKIIINLYKEKYQRIHGINDYEKYGMESEKKLSFYVDQKYFFDNVNIRNYDLKINERILLTVWQKKNTFLLDTVNTPFSMEKMSYVNIKNFKIFRKRKVFELTEDLYSLSDREKEGIIIQNCDELKKVNFLRENYGKVIFRLRPEYAKNSHFLSYFSQGELVQNVEGKYQIDFSCPSAYLSFKTIIRKYFESGLDGIYLDTTMYSAEDLEAMKSAILAVSTEYMKKIILYDKLSITGGSYGYYVVRDRDKIFKHPEYLDLYKFSGEFFLAAEVRNYDEVDKVPDVFKIVIVNNRL